LCSLLVANCSRGEIADRIGVSERTVRNMIASIRERFERAGYSEKEAF
jgi:HTH domain.